jgi:TRAP-type C4-dicarboxylate transport system substrate-binding protein
MKNNYYTRFRFIVAVCTLLILGMVPVHADAPLVIKVATLMPKGSMYHRVLQEVGEQWQQAQGNGAKFIIYTDGAQGSEADSVRRMRIGQLQAAMISVSGLQEIEPAVNALQKMPMMFRSWGEVDYVNDRLRPELEKKMFEKGFVVLFWGEGGWVQFFSKKPLKTPEDFRDQRLFAWAGDNAQVEIMKSLGYRPVVIEVADVLPALQTGMIDAAPLATMWSLVYQIDRAAPHMLPVKWVPIVGAAVMTRSAWEAMRPEAREVLRDISVKATTKLREHRRNIDEDAMRAMQGRGLHVTEMTPETERAWVQLATNAWPRIRGTMVPADTFDRVQKLLAEYRSKPQ